MSEQVPDHSLEDGGETRPATSPEMDWTQRSTPTRGLPSIPERGPVQPPVYYSPRRDRSKRKRKPPVSRRGSGLYLPLWSVLLMLAIVLGIAFGAVLLVVNIGGQNVPGGEPRIVIITAAPSSTPPGSVLASPTIPPQSDQDQGLPEVVPTIELAGPTLPPVVFSPTPDFVSVGRTVVVSGVQEQQLNIRDNPGINTNVLFRAPDGYQFLVVDGPVQADGLTWWKVQDPADGQAGWAASNYIEVVPEQQ